MNNKNLTLSIVAIVIAVVALVISVNGGITGFGVSKMPDTQCVKMADKIKGRALSTMEKCPGEVTEDPAGYTDFWIDCNTEKYCMSNTGIGSPDYTFPLSISGTSCEEVWWGYNPGYVWRDDITEVYTLGWNVQFGLSAYYKDDGGVIVTKGYAHGVRTGQDQELVVLCETNP